MQTNKQTNKQPDNEVHQPQSPHSSSLWASSPKTAPPSLGAVGTKPPPAPKAAINKKELELAEAKMALLAALLLLWCTERVQDIRRLVVNWDIVRHLSPLGAMQLLVWPVSSKNAWRPDAAISSHKDVGKICHPRIEGLFNEFVRVWRPVLLKSIGEHGGHHKTWTDEKDGKGANNLQTLFPGFWKESQARESRPRESN